MGWQAILNAVMKAAKFAGDAASKVPGLSDLAKFSGAPEWTQKAVELAERFAGGGTTPSTPAASSGGGAQVKPKPKPAGQVALAPAYTPPKSVLEEPVAAGGAIVPGAPVQRGAGIVPSAGPAYASPTAIIPESFNNPQNYAAATAAARPGATNFVDGAPQGAAPPPTIRPGGPLWPTMEGTRMGPLNQTSGQATLDARMQLFGDPNSPYLKPSYENPIVRGAKLIGQQVPILGALVPPTQGASFKDLSIDDIANDPKLLARWQGMTQQERVFALFDGTNKGADLMAAPQGVWDRLMGESETTYQNDLAITEQRGGVGGQALRGLGVTGSDMGAAPPVSEAGPTGVSRGAPVTAGLAGAIQGGGGQLAPGQISTSMMDIDKPTLWTVTEKGAGGDLKAGQNFSATVRQAQEWVNAGYIESRVKGSNEIIQIRQRDANGQPTGPTRNVKKSAYVSDPSLHENYTEIGGEISTVLDESGNAISVPREVATSYPGGSVPAESARGVTAYYDTSDPARPIVYPTEAELRASRGRYVPVEQRITQTNKKDVAMATDYRSTVAQTKDILDVMDLMTDRSFTWSGKAGKWAHDVLKSAGMEKEGRALFALASGSEKLTPVQLANLHATVRSWVNQRKMEILNDPRISETDQKRLNETVADAELFSNPEQVRDIIVKMTMYGLINSELRLTAAGKPGQYPVDSKEAFVGTVKELMRSSFTKDEAAFIASRLQQYRELNPGTPQ